MPQQNPLSSTNAVPKFLQERVGQRFTTRQIAECLVKIYPEESRKKKEASSRINTDKELIGRIQVEIAGARPTLQNTHPQIKTTEGYGRLYYWMEKSDQDEVSEAEETGAEAQPLDAGRTLPRENDLYPLLSEYLWYEFHIYSMRIDEGRSSNRQGPGGNKWLHPDLAGMEDLTADWHQEIKDVVKQYSDKKAKLWSFEVKKLLNRSNVREAFFQAVSNSSWANLGYLVAAEIGGAETMKELRILSSLHGIGLIQINPENPVESQILIPGRERFEVDWATCNRLTDENKDFLRFLKQVRQFHQTGDARPQDWDFQPDG